MLLYSIPGKGAREVRRFSDEVNLLLEIGIIGGVEKSGENGLLGKIKKLLCARDDSLPVYVVAMAIPCGRRVTSWRSRLQGRTKRRATPKRRKAAE